MTELNFQWWNDIADILASKIVPPVFRNSSSDAMNNEQSNRTHGQHSPRDCQVQSGNIPPRPPSSPRSGQPPSGCIESSPEQLEIPMVSSQMEPVLSLSDLPEHLSSSKSVRTAFCALNHSAAAGCELDLWGCGLPDEDLAAVVRLAVAHCRIRTIDLGRNTAGPSASAEIARLLEAAPAPPHSPSPAALTSLRLNGCGLGDDGLRALARGLASNAALQVCRSRPLVALSKWAYISYPSPLPLPRQFRWIHALRHPYSPGPRPCHRAIAGGPRPCRRLPPRVRPQSVSACLRSVRAPA